ncbi:hypothetical protein FACS1894180_2740 [Bacteroidia bacterium]|nr:hypothetical protein FACS1894180_2740 [Bacteroidia bacterium]
MKKFFISASIALFTLGAANAQTWEIGEPNITATLSGGTLTISGTGAIPDGGKPWSSLPLRTQITSLVIEEGITSIGQTVFYGCSSLTGTLTIPASVTEIRWRAFYGCPFTDIVNNSPSFKLASAASVGAAKILIADQTSDDFIYADSYAYGGSAIVGCLAVGVLTLPADVPYLPDFIGCSFTDIVNNCPRFKFASVASVGSAKVLMSNQYHPSDDFNYAEDRPYSHLAVGELTIPENVSSIFSDRDYHGIFEYCTGLTAVNFNAAYGTASSWNDQINSHQIFYHCTGIKTITIGENVTKIPGNIFTGCTGVTTVNYNAVSALPTEGYPTRSVFYELPLTTLNIGENVKSIPNFAFASQPNITGTLTLPEGLASIGYGAFSGCSGLTGTLTIPASVTNIDRYAFSGCTGFTGALTIPNGVKYIGSNAFGGCSGITTVNYNAENCIGVPSSYDSPFPKSFSTLNIGENVRKIPDGAFHGCTGITSTLTIPASVTNIGNYAFYNCPGITGTLTIPNSVTTIGNMAFQACRGITGTLTIPNSVTYLGGYAFSGCSGITGTLTIPASVTTINNYAFRGCSGITGTVTIPNSVTTIHGQSFYDCSNITTVILPVGLTDIIQSEAFRNCSALSDIYNPQSTPPAIVGNAFYGVNTNTCTLHIPTGSLAAYQAAAVWQDFLLEEMDFPVYVLGISVSHSAQTLAEGQTQQLAAAISPANAANQNLSWQSSNESIATVSAAGLVTAVSAGAASITATTEDGGYTASCAVTVIRPATGVTLNKTAVTLHIGDTEQLTATVLPAGASNQNITWSSSNTAVATVDATGKITATSVGIINIYAITEDGGYYASCIVNVTRFESVTLSITLAAGEQLQMAAAVIPAPGPYELQPVTWQSSNTGIATVIETVSPEGGKVTAVSEGTALISATTFDGAIAASCLITVTASGTTGTSGSPAYSQLTIYPNPANDYLQFAMNNVEIRSVEILDAAGRIVGALRATSQSDGTQTIPVAHLPSGVYLLKIDTDKGVQTARFVKK